jgi:hypothetical protein
MRKLFVLFLLVALVPFTVGCNGLWDFDDDDDPVLVKAATSVVKPVVTVSSAIAAGLRASFDAWSIVMSIGGQDYYPVDVQVSGSNTIITYPEIDVTSLFVGDATSTTVPAIITINGEPVNVSLTASKLSTSSTKAVTTKTITISQATTGEINVTVDNETVTSTNPVSTTDQYIVSVKYDGAAVSGSSAAPTTVNTVEPMFSIVMNNAVTAINAWTFTVTNVTTGASFDMALADGLVTAVVDPADTTNKTIKVTVVGGNGKTLDNGSTYKVEYKTGTINGTAFTKAVAPRYIKVVLAQ